MPVLNIAIGKTKYTIDCDDGEENKVLDLANKLNEKVNNLSLVLRGADEKTILMLCALDIQDELESFKNNKSNSKEIDNSVEEKLVEEIGRISETVLKLANKIENL